MRGSWVGGSWSLDRDSFPESEVPPGADSSLGGTPPSSGPLQPARFPLSLHPGLSVFWAIGTPFTFGLPDNPLTHKFLLLTISFFLRRCLWN